LSCDEVRDVDEFLNAIFESLANPVRRKILEVLDSEGPLPYTELMRRCGIRDSRTLKHHLEKLGSLVAKDRGGTYMITRLGCKVLRLAESLREELVDVVAFARTPKPLITFRQSIRHYVACALLLLTFGLASGILGLYYLTMASVLLMLAILLAASIKRSKVIVVGTNSVIEVVTTPISNYRKVIRCSLLGAEVSTNVLLKLFGLAKVSLITNADGSLRTYTLGLTTLRDARKYTEAISKLLESSEVRLATLLER